jgi:hypothetical protein
MKSDQPKYEPRRKGEVRLAYDPFPHMIAVLGIAALGALLIAGVLILLSL